LTDIEDAECGRLAEPPLVLHQDAVRVARRPRGARRNVRHVKAGVPARSGTVR
jgi:hypothetical protein